MSKHGKGRLNPVVTAQGDGSLDQVRGDCVPPGDDGFWSWWSKDAGRYMTDLLQVTI